jgi:hypothetical protein
VGCVQGFALHEKSIAMRNENSGTFASRASLKGSFRLQLFNDLFAHDDGSGMAVYAIGCFKLAGGVAAEVLPKGDNSGWHPVAGAGPGGITGEVEGAVYHDPGSGPELLIFGTVANGPSGSWVHWDDQGFHAIPSLSELFFAFHFDSLPAAGAFPAGLHLLHFSGSSDGPLKVKLNFGGSSAYPERSGAMSGQTLYYQARYRDGGATCNAGNFNLTNAVEILWGV